MPLLLVMGAAAPVRPSARLTAGSEGSTDGADQAAQHATLRPAAAAAADIPFRNVDSDVEQRLLELANQSRAQAAASPLTLDAGLSRAARAHAEAMVAAGQLSHQFLGEPSLPQRLATTSNLLLERSGENVALDYNAAGAHQHLMLSPHHRENLLNPAYNVVGLGVVRSGDRLYIVQDFGHALPNYSLPEVKDRIAATVQDARHRGKRPSLARRDLPMDDRRRETRRLGSIEAVFCVDNRPPRALEWRCALDRRESGVRRHRWRQLRGLSRR
jgi:uncharacterized protein YkwD